MNQILSKEINTPDNQKMSLPLRGLHWLMALILIAAWAFIYTKGIFEKGSDEREFLKHLHVLSGLLIFILLPLRIIIRWLSPLPEITSYSGRKKKLFTQALHIIFYLCMIVLPILGIIFMQMGGKTISVAGFELPAMIQIDEKSSRSVKEIHEFLGLVMLYLAVIHVGVALWHHFFLRDNSLKRMLLNSGTAVNDSPVRSK
jgi:cytochrome b561